MNQNSEYLKQRALELHQSLTSMGDSFFMPTGWAFLTLGIEHKKILAGEDPDLTVDKIWPFYAQWHEAVHMAQIVSSPYVFIRAKRLAEIAHSAYEDTQNASLDTLKKEYQSIMSELETPVGGCSPWEIIETQAVSQGLLGAMRGNNSSLCQLANYLYTTYKSCPEYVRLLNVVSKVVGDETTFRLLPRLCFAALESNIPPSYMADLIGRVVLENSAKDICEYTPREFCQWAGIDMEMASKSLRERVPQIRHHTWFQLFTRYFDDYEQLDTDNRLSLIMGEHCAETFKMFRPNTVYSSGDIILSREVPPEHEYEEKIAWIKITEDLLDGMKLLVT